MSISIAVYNNDFNNFLLKFLIQDKKYQYFEIEKLNKSTFKKIIIIPQSLDKNLINDFLKWCDLNINTNIIILMSQKMIKNNFSEKYKFVYYPVSISKFEEIISEDIQNIYLDFSNILLTNNNLKNTTTKKNVGLTNTEQEILLVLFNLKKIKREKLEHNILNFAFGVKSKSLDSHLARIRKKLFQIDAKINLSSIDSKYIVLESICN